MFRFEIEFVDGVQGEAVTSRKRAEEMCGDVIDALQLTPEQREQFGQLAALARPANRRVKSLGR